MAAPRKVDQHPLVGRGFHTTHANGRTEWQGTVTADCGGGYFLIQLYSWLMGERSTAHVIHIADLAALHPNGRPRFRFFDDLPDACEYYEAHAVYDDKEIDREAASSPPPKDG